MEHRGRSPETTMPNLGGKSRCGGSGSGVDDLHSELASTSVNGENLAFAKTLFVELGTLVNILLAVFQQAVTALTALGFSRVLRNLRY